MPPRRTSDSDDTASPDASSNEQSVEPGAESEVEPDVLSEGGDDDEDEDEVAIDGDLDTEGETAEEEEVEAPKVRVAPRPSPGRPPTAKEEPEPPFYVGERVVLIKNTRPRTGSPIGDHPVGATGRVETVLSQTAIIRFDRAPDIKEVVAFVCLES